MNRYLSSLSFTQLTASPSRLKPSRVFAYIDSNQTSNISLFRLHVYLTIYTIFYINIYTFKPSFTFIYFHYSVLFFSTCNYRN